MSALQLPTPRLEDGSGNEFMRAQGYSENLFEDKVNQMTRVVGYISNKGFLPAELIENEVTWFYKYVAQR